MAESKGALLAKSVQKHAGRAKEKILQNLGKVDRTADEIFDEHLQNFTRQQNAANRLQKEFNNYIRCVRAVQAASKTLMDSLNEIYESNWTGHDLLYVQAQNCEMLWQDFSHKLGDQVLIPLNTYQSQFPEMRKKIEKRGRKLVDFDSQRHSYQSLQQSNPKKRDELKMVRARESLEEAKRTYEMLNSELHDELPALYDSRVLFLVTNLQTFFAAEQVFHCESAKVFGELEAIVDKLATECQRGSYTVKKSSPKSPKISTSNNNMIQSVPSSPTSIGGMLTAVGKRPIHMSYSSAGDDNQGPPPPSPSSPPPSAPSPEPAAENPPPTAAAPPRAEAAPKEGDEPRPQVNGNAKPTPTSAVPDGTAPGKKVEELYDIPVGATTDNLPPGVLYRVKATYKYNREDVDELSFDVGEIIRVVEYDDPEEQEEGWLMGVKEGTGEKGMFPANFTRPL